MLKGGMEKKEGKGGPGKEVSIKAAAILERKKRGKREKAFHFWRRAGKGS